jgi:cell wall-associated NlpC family hydrolase
VVAAYRQLGVDLAARGLASTATFHADTKFLKPLTREQLAPGDLIMYQPKNGIGHVVIYMGNGQAIEAAGGKGVTMSTVNWDRVKSFRRVPLPE